MKKQTQKSQKKNKSVRDILSWKLLIFACVLGLLFAGSIHLFWAIQRYETAAWQASKVASRDLIFSAVDGLLSPAPRDPMNGDYYLPEAKLFLTSDQFNSILYRYDAEGYLGNGETVTLTSEPVVNRAKIALYQSENERSIEKMWEGVPALQACARKYILMYQQPSEQFENYTLDRTLTLNNGRTLYVYRDTGCTYDDVGTALDQAINTLKAY